MGKEGTSKPKRLTTHTSRPLPTAFRAADRLLPSRSLVPRRFFPSTPPQCSPGYRFRFVVRFASSFRRCCVCSQGFPLQRGVFRVFDAGIHVSYQLYRSRSLREMELFFSSFRDQILRVYTARTRKFLKLPVHRIIHTAFPPRRSKEPLW